MSLATNFVSDIGDERFRLTQLVQRFPQVKVLVVGDPMLDVYHFGRVDRMSQEAPVPVFLEERKEVRPGGAANVAENLRTLGCVETVIFPEVTLVTRKHRYMVGHQQLLRIDEDQFWTPAKPDVIRAVEAAGACDVIVLCDYAKGWLTYEMCRSLVSVGKPVVVDPKGMDWAKYAGARVICPNDQEWCSVNCRHPDGAALVVKQGSQGILLRTEGSQSGRLFPATARTVFDVVGAGDTVTAVVAATLAVGGALEDAARLANLAAGHVVGVVGTAACPIGKLLELIAQ